MKFQILIPTFNREKDLEANLIFLRNQIMKFGLTRDFGIVVSDNASTDGTEGLLKRLADEWGGTVNLKVVRNDANIGLERNSIKVMNAADAEYVIWLGDDDFLADGYLHFLKEKFANSQLGWMVPGVISIAKGMYETDPRPADFPFKEFFGGYKTVFEISHFGHQLSGLVVKREGLLESYLAVPNWRNVYLFIYFLSRCQLKYNGIYAPAFKTRVNNFNAKDWGYNDIGLLDEVFKSYYYLGDVLSVRQVNKLLLRFVVMHSYRLQFKKGYHKVLQQWKSVCAKSTGTKRLKVPLLITMTKEYLSQNMRRRNERTVL